MEKSILEVQNLTKYYGKIKGIENVSISLSEGEIFGFIGPNGAGKSTTIRSIMNLINNKSVKMGLSFTTAPYKYRVQIDFCYTAVYNRINVNRRGFCGLPT